MRSRRPLSAEALGALLDRQRRRWEIESTSPRQPIGAPCVAVSGWPGAGGRALGAQVAEWLDYGFFDGPALEAIAADAEASRRVGTALAPAGHVTPVLEALGQRGNALVLGRGGAFALPPERTLRVLVVAPRSRRAEWLAAEEGLGKEEAGRRLAVAEAARADYVRVHFDRDPDDPALYDLTLNTATLSADAGGRIVIEALRRRFPQAG